MLRYTNILWQLFPQTFTALANILSQFLVLNRNPNPAITAITKQQRHQLDIKFFIDPVMCGFFFAIRVKNCLAIVKVCAIYSCILGLFFAI